MMLRSRYLHGALWLILFLCFFVSSFHRNGDIALNFFRTTCFIGFLPPVFYLVANGLGPRFLEKKRYLPFAVWTLAVVLGISLIRIFFGYLAFYCSPIQDSFYRLSIFHTLYVLVIESIAAVVAFLYASNLNYQRLLIKQEQVRRVQAEAELTLLKATVQPHFLFNNLNNLYSLVINHSDKTASYLSKLSESLRYFVEQVSKPLIPWEMELDFLENYIALEQLKKSNLPVLFQQHVEQSLLKLPPMLLIPLVENCFKHGDPTQSIEIRLWTEGGLLCLYCSNTLKKHQLNTREGTGLANLERRLSLLFGNAYTLNIQTERQFFIVTLKIPYQQ